MSASCCCERDAAKGVAGFADDAKLLGHFEKHGAEFGVKSADEYLQVGKDIMKHGHKVEYAYKGEMRTGFVQFMENTRSGNAKFAFVGTNANGGYIVTCFAAICPYPIEVGGDYPVELHPVFFGDPEAVELLEESPDGIQQIGDGFSCLLTGRMQNGGVSRESCVL